MDTKNVHLADYVWLDGATPTQELRYKTRIFDFESGTPSLDHFSEWSFDGSSTNQATGDNSDCILQPVFFCKNPLHKQNRWVVLCEVLNSDGTPHQSNQRALLRKSMKDFGAKHEPYVGFEQEYTLFYKDSPLGWPENGYPAPQGPFYCGVGASVVSGRDLVEEHTACCIEAGLNIYGTNAEVMLGQWEFQIGPRGVSDEKCDPLTMSDHSWIARFFLHAISEKHGVKVSFSNKPMFGDWNGAGMHTNFSTKEMRTQEKGLAAINEAVKHLENNHRKHIEGYGYGLSDRLTGLHETCSINDFKSGVSDRGASIRIPLSTSKKGFGYLEDRRPGANSDPYVVSNLLVSSICAGS